MEQCTYQSSLDVMLKLSKKNKGRVINGDNDDFVTCGLCNQLLPRKDFTLLDHDDICKDCELETERRSIAPISAITAIEFLKEWMGLKDVSIQVKNDQHIILDATEYDEKIQSYKYRVDIHPDNLGSYAICRMKVDAIEIEWEWVDCIPQSDSIYVIAN